MPFLRAGGKDAGRVSQDTCLPVDLSAEPQRLIICLALSPSASHVSIPTMILLNRYHYCHPLIIHGEAEAHSEVLNNLQKSYS
jgi:hypothetical protein